MRRKLGQHPDRELMLAHNMANSGVVRKACKEVARGRWVREVGQWFNPVERVLSIGRSRRTPRGSDLIVE